MENVMVAGVGKCKKCDDNTILLQCCEDMMLLI